MQKYGTDNVADIGDKHKKRSVWQRIVFTLAVIVVFCTTYALILPAITMEDETHCGFEQHMHDKNCYDLRLVCGCDEQSEEMQPDALSDGEQSADGDETSPSRENHVHTDECYENVLICNKEEHTHQLICYSDTEADTENESDWERAVSQAKLDGTFAQNLACIAETQLGYKESTLNYVVESDGETKKGYTRYGEFDGNPYKPWNNSFVRFCFKYAGIPEKCFPVYSNERSWINELSKADRRLFEKSIGRYTPSRGDIVFIDSDGDSIADRTAIITSLKYETELLQASEKHPIGFNAIEGDCENAVKEKFYSIDDSAIIGYGALSRANPNIELQMPENTAAVQLEDIQLEEAVRYVGIRITTISEANKKNLTPTNAPPAGYDNTSATFSLRSYGYTEGSDYYFLIPIEEPFNESTSCTVENMLSQYGYVFNPDEARQFICRGFKVDGNNYTYDSGNYYYYDIDYVQYQSKWYARVHNAVSRMDSFPDFILYYLVPDVYPYTVTPSSTVINMFDYWIEENRFDSDNHDIGEGYTAGGETGINKGHTFKFGREMGKGNIISSTMGNLTYGGKINYSWGGSNKAYFADGTPGVPLDENHKFHSKTTQGIVKNCLGADGYPVFNGNTNIGLLPEDDGKSLDYLFSPTVEHEGKKSFPKCKNLLWLDDDGYFYYNSAQRYAQLDESTRTFTVYDMPAGKNTSIPGIAFGQFYPFNDIRSVFKIGSTTYPVNHYFGLSLTTRFIQYYNGYTNSEKTTHTTFDFSGDNDVWIFIDGVLVGDIGGLGSARKITIDFATGLVDIDDYTGITPGTTIYDAFVAAGRGDDFEWLTFEKDGVTYRTFPNNTTHVLKFFYLERGNVDSNLSLKYNLTEIPSSGIYKVDQYGDVISGATFAVYDAQKGEDGKYRFILDNGETVENLDNYNIDHVTGRVTDSDDNVVINKPPYVGKTDIDGQMVFSDSDDMPYSYDELVRMFTSHIILKEISIPEGYRTVTDDIYLYFSNGMMESEDPYSTGVWATANGLITATNTLYVAPECEEKMAQIVQRENPNNVQLLHDSSVIDDYYAIDYYNVESGVPKGILFAVPLKRNNAEANASYISDLVFDGWHPIYGNHINGYTVHSGTDMNAVFEAVNNQALIDSKDNTAYYGNIVFHYSAGGMQLNLKNLPGKSYEYYDTVIATTPEDAQGNIPITSALPQYTIAYYYSTASAIEDATPENTVRVLSNSVTTPIGDLGFNIQFGSTVEVPNLENRLFVQKLSDDGDILIDGAKFAMYKVEEDSEEHIRYVVNDNVSLYLAYDENANLHGYCGETYGSREYTYFVRSSGRIEIYNDEECIYSIYPAKNGVGNSLVETTTSDNIYCSEEGTLHYERIKTGKYVLREISAPPGYVINPTETLVYIDGKAVYANAGTADDGVSVGKGPGYIASTLDVFASEGDIDETLSWIYTALDINNSLTFAGFENGEWVHAARSPDDPPGCSSQTTDNLSAAMVTYLDYYKDQTNALFDYSPNVEEGGQSMRIDSDMNVVSGAGEGTLRLYTETGWNTLRIYQDYLFGAARSAEKSAETGNVVNYDDLRSQGDIQKLFSKSTFVRVKDKKDVNLVVLKVSDEMMTDNKGKTYLKPLDGAEFVVYRKDGETTMYYEGYDTSSQSIIWKDESELMTADGIDYSSVTQVSQTDGDAKAFFKIQGLVDGEYFIKEINAPPGYKILKEPIRFIVDIPKPTAYGDNDYSCITADGYNVMPIDRTSPYYIEESFGVNQYAIKLVDNYAGIPVTVNKVFEGDRLTPSSNPTILAPVKGARFVLYYETDESPDGGQTRKTTYYCTDYTEENGITWTNDPENAYRFGGDDISSFTIGGLSDGTYYLLETYTPAEYDTPNGPVKITVSEGAVTSVEDPSYRGHNNIRIRCDDEDNIVGYDIYVVNISSYELPATGGCGTALYTMAGLLLTGCAAYLLYRTNRRRREGSPSGA